jgi:predicted ABC-type ATPase
MATLPNSPLLIAIVGVNGAGKSTITARLRQEPGFPSNYVNPDEIALTLTDIDDPIDRVYTAARKADEQRNTWLANRQSMAFETVMSHPSKIEFMQSAKDAGYRIMLVFVGLSSPELSLQRVRQRVQSGGHDVPREKIMARYDRVMALLPDALQVADRALIYDNSDDDDEARLVISFNNGRIGYESIDLPEWLRFLI